MRLILLASALLMALGSAAQNSPSAPPSAGQSVAPPIILSQGRSDTCLAIRTIWVRPTERFEPGRNFRVRTTTCTPANRFRAEYIPNPTIRRDAVPADCPDCSALPNDGNAVQVQPVREPK